MQVVNVLAILTAVPGQRARVIAHLKAIEETVRMEVGCIEYQITTDLPDASPNQANVGENTFVVIEKWETLEDLKAHSSTAHMVEFSQMVGSLIAAKDVHILVAD